MGPRLSSRQVKILRQHLEDNGLGRIKPKALLRRTTMDWLKKRWKERTSQNGIALIAIGVVAIVFKPLVGIAAYAAIAYGAYQICKKG